MAMETLSEQVGLEVAPQKSTWLDRVPFTLFVLAASIGVSLGWWAGRSISFVDSTAGIWDGQYWRFITSTFVHINVAHLASCVVLTWLMGLPIECRYGPWRTAALYCVLAVGSNAAQCLAGGLGIGMSGVLYGYWGLLLAAGNRANGPKVKHPRIITVLMLLSVALSVLAFFRGATHVGFVAHGVGLAIGLAMGCALRAARPFPWLVTVAVASIALAPATLYMPWSYQWWWHRAQVLYKRGEREQSLTAGRRAAMLAPDDEAVARLLIHLGEETLRQKAYEEAVHWFSRATYVTALPPTAEIEFAAALYKIHDEAAARWHLLRVNPGDLTVQQRENQFYSWYLNWARVSATQPSATPETDSQPGS
jgi:membrane associated rhomboid family serine protease